MTKAEDGERPAQLPKDQAPETQKAPTAGRRTGDIHQYIGTRLREAFDDIASQPVPDRFLDLMRQLDKA